jgi:WD40 repeat protein
MRLWDIATGKLVRRFEGHTGTVTSVAISPDGRWVISGSGDDDEPFDNTARIWDVATGQLRHRFDMGRLCVFDVGFSADSQQAIAGANNCRTYVWDIEGRREIQLYAEGVGAVLSVAFTPDGKHAISGHADNLLRIWDLATGKQSFCSQPAETGGWVWSIGVAPNGQYAYTGASGTVQEWGISAKPCKNRSFYVLHDVDKRVCAIALNSDGKTLATSGHDSRVILWDAATGKPLRQWKFPHQEKPAEPWIPPGAVNDGLAKCTETILKKSARRSLRAKRTPTRPSDEVCRRPHAAAPRTLRWRDSSRHCRSSVISPC